MRKIFTKSTSNTYTVKWDGCVHGDTIVLTNKGDIKIKDIVTNFDESDNLRIMGRNLESAIVYDHFVNLIDVNSSEGTKKWVEVFLENGSSLKLTEDHEVHTKNRGWVIAGALTEDDDITEL
jgi:intein/homing endonuclease